MLYIILSVLAVSIGGYFVFRYVSLIYAFKKIIKEISDIQQDLTQNQILHLPIPNRHLKALLFAVNKTLEEIQKERQKYEMREKEFQKQIENISHDLRTPLTVMIGYLKLIKKSGNDQTTAEELLETVDIIEQKAGIMKHLITQFYDFSRLYAGDYELQLTHVDVSRTLRESFMGNYQILEQAHLEINLDIPDYPVWVLGETSALERIFLNLFQNAGRYARTFFCISIKECGEYIAITFLNDTNVLSAEDVPHLFDRFYMQDKSRNQGGTGLGLTVARSLAEEMGAQLKVFIPAGSLTQEKNPVNAKTETFQIGFQLCMKPIIK